MIVKHKVDVLISLDSLNSDIWEMGFTGDIMYVPIKDFGILPLAIAKEISDKIIEKLKAGKKCGMFCIGGHGRTGYLAAIILGKLGIEDPIEKIRKEYCEDAIESLNQIYQISQILDKKSLLKHKSTFEAIDYYYPYTYLFNGKSNYQDECCGTCGFYIPQAKFFGSCTTGICHIDAHRTLSNDSACKEWIDERRVLR
jgi:hypothetical protein